MSRPSSASLTLSMAASSPTFATRNIVSPFIVHPRKVELEKAAVLLDQLTVRVQCSALAQVADEVGVHARLVLAAGLRVGAAYGEVDRPPELPEVPGPGVDVEKAHQVLLALLRARLDDPAVLEA